MLTPLLAAMALVQLLLPGATTLPAEGPVAGMRMRGAAADPPPVAPVLDAAARAMFAPSGAPGAGGGAGPADPLGGTMIAGSVHIGRRQYAIVQAPGGAVSEVAVGGTIAGWQLRGLTATGALLGRGGAERLTVPFGTRAAVAAAAPESSSSGEDQ